MSDIYDARWMRQLDEYVAIREREGRDPSQAVPAERRSNRWITKVRQHAESLPDDRRRALDERAPGWRTPRTTHDARWARQLDEYVAIREREGCDPSSRVAAEKKSYRWIRWVREREGSLSDDRRRALDERAPGWQTPRTVVDAQWWQQLDEYVAIREREGRDPSSRVPVERRSYGWINGVRRREDSLSDDRRRALDERVPGWRTPRSLADAQWWQRLDEYVAFREREGRDPSSVIPTEKKFYSWIGGVRRSEDTLPAERIRALDERARGWRAPHSTRNARWWRHLDEYVAFREREGRDPSQRVPAEKTSYHWINGARRREGTLPAERIRALDERAPGWRAQRTGVDARWWRHLDEYAAFREREGRDPLQRAPSEAAVYTWIRGNRRQGDALPAAKARALDHRVPGWRDPFTIKDVKWWRRMGEYVAFRAREGRDPSHKRPSEKTLYNWIAKAREREEHLSVERCQALDRLAPGWRVHVSAWDSR